MKYKQCPACSYETYEMWYEHNEDGMHTSPDEGWCFFCGFTYSEHCKHPLSEQVEEHVKRKNVELVKWKERKDGREERRAEKEIARLEAVENHELS